MKNEDAAFVQIHISIGENAVKKKGEKIQLCSNPFVNQVRRNRQKEY